MPSLTAISKRLALVLRHRPESIGLVLDAAGWADVAAVLVGLRISRATLDEIVASDQKGRYTLSADGARIRAEQGHSVPVALGHPVAAPPATLFHGTAAPAIAAIRAEGLLPRARHDVHLSAERATAAGAGGRRGAAIVLEVDAAAMAAAGHVFTVSGNGVWLVAAVPPAFIRFPGET